MTKNSITKTDQSRICFEFLNLSRAGFEHSDFDIVSDFDIRILATTITLSRHVELPKWSI